MMLFRRIYLSDFDSVYALTQNSGIGITTLPKDKELLHQRVSHAVSSFDAIHDMPLPDAYYLFVLENTETHTIVGTAAIEASAGFSAPFYSYRLATVTQICYSLGIRHDHQILRLVNDYQGASELCTLFLDKQFRVNNNGLLLSRARFLFMANHIACFHDPIIAEMRGISDDSGHSPFWDHVGAHFFHMSFAEADRLTLSTNKQFIADLMPRDPIQVSLLPAPAQAVIGKPHPLSIPAMTILLREGFRYNGTVDIFDAGPTLETSYRNIRTIQSSKVLTVRITNNLSSNKPWFIATIHGDFKALIRSVEIDLHQGLCLMTKQTAQDLAVDAESQVRVSPLQLDFSE